MGAKATFFTPCGKAKLMLACAIHAVYTLAAAGLELHA
jgi:hypothetical protein